MEVFRSLRNASLIAVAVLIHGFAAGESLGAESRPVVPGDLRGQCRVIDSVVLMNDYESTSLTLVDQNGKKLYFAYGGSNGDMIHYGKGPPEWVQSVTGGDQEKTLLEILRQTMAAQFTPPPASDRKYSDYLALKHSLFVLDYRCRHKTGTIPWRVVTKNWTFNPTR